MFCGNTLRILVPGETAWVCGFRLLDNSPHTPAIRETPAAYFRWWRGLNSTKDFIEERVKRNGARWCAYM